MGRIAKRDIIQHTVEQFDFVFAVRALRRDDPSVLSQDAEVPSRDYGRDDDERGFAGRRGQPWTKLSSNGASLTQPML